MKINRIEKLTPYPDINRLLADWAQGSRRIIGEGIVGLYLTGSLSYGDFVLDRSDVDLQAVVLKPLTEDELTQIEQLHKHLEIRYPAWAGRIECSYVPLKLMERALPEHIHRPWWGFGKLYKTALAGNEWLINHYFLAKSGIALEGPEFNTLIPAIDIREVRRASARDLFKEWKPKIDDRDWLANGHFQSYLVLNLCRILHTVIGNGPASKKVAAEWAKAAYSQWASLIEEAERWVYGKNIDRADDSIAFIKFAIEKVNESDIQTSSRYADT